MIQGQVDDNAEAKKDDNDDHNDHQGGSGNVNAEKATEEAPSNEPQANQGTLILDATCIPSDIKYLT
ncbi:MAG: hypothetical protein FNP40_06025 [Dehalobacter sp. 4CP]|nr:hypothetical protein [Dehalobacter sp. 4CP]